MDKWSPLLFSRKEIVIVSSYLRVANIQEVAIETEYTKDQVETTLKKVIRRLRYPKTHETFEEAVEAKKTNIILKDDFLNTPLENLRTILSTSILSTIGNDGGTMAEVLEKTSERQLLLYRSFGKTKLIQLKEVLKEYDCLDLLKK